MPNRPESLDRAASPEAPRKNPLVAVAWVAAALTSFTVMVIPVRALAEENMHAFEMLFFRSAIGVAIIAAVLTVQSRRRRAGRGGGGGDDGGGGDGGAPGWATLRTRRIAGHALRNVIHFAGQTFWIFGLTLLPLATVSAIEFTVPIWASLLAVLLLGEGMNRGRWIALGLGVAGVLIILRPGLAVVPFGALIMLACTFCFGATNAATKWLTRTENPLAILFYMVSMQTLLGAVASVFVWLPPEPRHLPWLALLALAGLSAHYTLTRALAAADVTFIAPFEFLRLPFVAAVGYLLYDELFDPVILLGAALIFGGNYHSIRQERRAARRE